VERWSATSCPFLPAASKERVAAERSGGTDGRKLFGTLLDCICRLLRVPDMVEAEIVKGQTPKMMDRERQEKDLQEVFDATQAAYLAAIENTFALQERTLEFTRTLIEAPEEALRTQAESNHAMLKTLIEESRRHREAMETLVRESAKVYESFLRSPFSHHQNQSKFEEARGTPEVKP
jgi:hypothetical protein